MDIQERIDIARLTISTKMDNRSDDDFSDWTHLSGFSGSQPTIPTSIKQLLVGRVFVGEYIERHYVDSLSTYRDLVVVNSDELDLSRSLIKAKQIILNMLRHITWLGMTDNQHDATPKGLCLWVNLSQVPLGKHWFQIQSIDLNDKEVSLKLNHLRPFDYSKNQTEHILAPEQIMENFDVQKFFQELTWVQIREFGLHLLVDVSTWCILNLKNVLTYENIRETIKFSSVLFLTVISFLIEATRFFCDYSIRLMRELSYVIHSLTPIIMGIIDFFAKCVGGFYLLLVMLWRGSSGPQVPPNALSGAFGRNSISSQKSIGYNNRGRNRLRGRFSNY
ncbi:uncharacterized protein LOC105688850 [Athalia rosae]|uniref:uncharacterized protein LOC105688850 n=1 Tax=Athalia rosae TaxID=37344 RepID=UPI002033F9D2|nr:uncharacterized protein LOC105688850 [Athalia rosae]XP_012260873.2 uncharacterized protein LOC105688850 [Athalia rosae]